MNSRSQTEVDAGKTGAGRSGQLVEQIQPMAVKTRSIRIVSSMLLETANGSVVRCVVQGNDDADECSQHEVATQEVEHLLAACEIALITEIPKRLTRGHLNFRLPLMNCQSKSS